MIDLKENNAQKYSSNKDFIDDDKKTGKERTISGSEVDKTYWSDGSTTTHFGGPCGDIETDEYGEEC